MEAETRSASTGAGADGADGNLAEEVAGLRRRLAFYEGFDELIQQNIGRSGDLLRRASEQQAEAERSIAAARADLARAASDQRDALGMLAEELTRMRAGLDALAGRLDSARADLDRFSRPGAAPAAMPKPGFAPAPAQTPSGDSASADPAVVVEATGGVGAKPNGSAAHADRTDALANSEPRVVREDSGSVIVHGINGVDAARAYQSWLAGRPGVRSVTPREFGGGVLRLDVAGVAFPGVDAAGWPGGPLDVVETGPGATVLRVRGAAGL